MNNLIPTSASATTAVKNVFDIVTSLVSMRKKNKLITAGQLQQLGTAIRLAVEADRMAGMHTLMVNGRNKLMDSFNQIKDYANTPFGDMLLETVRDECRYYKGYCDNFDRLTKFGGLL